MIQGLDSVFGLSLDEPAAANWYVYHTHTAYHTTQHTHTHTPHHTTPHTHTHTCFSTCPWIFVPAPSHHSTHGEGIPSNPITSFLFMLRKQMEEG